MKASKIKDGQMTGADLLKNESSAQVVSLSAETVEAIADAIAQKREVVVDAVVEKLAQVVIPLMILHSRFCAADTVRTSERPDTVFRHAIKEAEIAKAELNKHFQAIDA